MAEKCEIKISFLDESMTGKYVLATEYQLCSIPIGCIENVVLILPRPNNAHINHFHVRPDIRSYIRYQSLSSFSRHRRQRDILFYKCRLQTI